MKVPLGKTQARTANGASAAANDDMSERIRRRAFELYERRGRADGQDIEDWLQAEAEIAAELSQPVATAAVKKSRRAGSQISKAKTTSVKKPTSSMKDRSKEETPNGS